MDLAKVLIYDPCPLGLPVILSVAHQALSMNGPRRLDALLRPSLFCAGSAGLISVQASPQRLQEAFILLMMEILHDLI